MGVFGKVFGVASGGIGDSGGAVGGATVWDMELRVGGAGDGGI